MFVYTALPPTEVRAGGELVEAGPALRDGAWYVTRFLTVIPPQRSVTFEVDVEGTLPPTRTWALDLVRQPGVNDDTLALRLEVPQGWDLEDGPLEVDGTVASRSWSLATKPEPTVRAVSRSALL